MADKNNTQLDPILLRMMRAPGRPSPMPGAGAFADNPFLLRQMQSMQPRIMGGFSKAKPSSYIPEGYNKEDVKRFLRYYGIPIRNERTAASGTTYLSFGENQPGKGPSEKKARDFTIRFSSPDLHMGNIRGKEAVTLIDTADVRKEKGGPGIKLGLNDNALKNAAGEFYSNPKALMEAIFWRTGQKLVPESSQPSILRYNPHNLQKPEIKEPFLQDPNQVSGISNMLHMDKEQRAPVIAGGTSDQPLSSKGLSQRFNLNTPRDMSNFTQSYDPLTDPNYLQLLSLVRKYAKPPGNDR